MGAFTVTPEVNVTIWNTPFEDIEVKENALDPLELCPET